MITFEEAYNAAVARKTDDLYANFSEFGVPPDQGVFAASWCAVTVLEQLSNPATAAACTFVIGVMAGIEWERGR